MTELSEVPERKIGEEEDGSPRMRRVMTQEMIEERERLNAENTAPAHAARARAERAKLNGHTNGNGHGKLPDNIVR